MQFIKGGWQPGEAKALELFGEALHWHALGEGFTWETQDRERDRQLGATGNAGSHIGSNRLHDLRIDAIALLTHQRFAAELEENALEAHWYP